MQCTQGRQLFINCGKTEQKYDTHVPTSFFQKSMIGVGSSFLAFLDPMRADLVAALGETTGNLSLRWIRQKMLESESGKEILLNRPSLAKNPKFSPDYMSLLPSDTLGGGYYKYMHSHGFKTSERPAVRFIDDEELAYVMMRYRETHDFYHVLADLPPTILGELAVKAFEFIQLKLPMTALSGFAVLKLSPQEQRIYFTELLPWAWHCARNCKFLMNYEFEKHIDDPIEQVRKELLFEKAPTIPKQ
jgi:ubiquinone biosynthesis protein COQ4